MTPRAGTYALAAAMVAGMIAVYVTSFVVAPDTWMRVPAVLLGVLALVGAGLAIATSSPPARVRLMDVASALASTLATFLLARDLGVEPVVAASLVLVTFGLAAQPLGLVDGRAARAGFAGAFVGLIGPAVTISWYWVALAGAIAGVLWSLIGPSVMPGFGGRIGLMAFMGAVAAFTLADLVGDRGNVSLLPVPSEVPTWSLLPVCAFAALITWTLRNRTGLNYATCVGVPTLVISAGIALAPNLGNQGAVMATAWLGGAALAGTSLTRLPNAGWVFVAALLYGCLMMRFTGPYAGHAGVIGTLAVIAELATFAARRTLQRAAVQLPGKPRVA